ncbi:unnamed protein product [Brassicogethes aeneus]|uniref:Serpin domain-containing protein n=1 Tax=Brassicogethes aeneus TaxID=1431903 RepID=A0A9P0FL42_BRAAE|nr:unnamed protein product [Brassicogethes aeneus]
MPVANRQMYPQAALASAPLSPMIPTKNLSTIRGTQEYEQAVDQIISNGILKTTLAINKVIASSAKDHARNIVFAPMSITGALALILLGSNGKTFQEITSVMGLATGIEKLNVKSQIIHEQFGRMIRKMEAKSGIEVGKEVNIASAIFVQADYPIRALYAETARSIYGSEVLNVDFQKSSGLAQQNINSWVSSKTNGKITEIIADDLPQSTRVVIVSAMYFKAQWEFPFFPGTTNKRPFYTNGRKSKATIEVEMMSNGGYFPYYKDHNLNCEVLGFPYKGNKTTMYVVMPFNSNKDVLKELELRITPEDINRLVDSTVYTKAVLLFPKMRIESTIDLKESLQSLGVKTLFDPSEANLGLLSPGVRGDIVKPMASSSIPVKAPLPLPVNRHSENDNDVLIFSRLRDVSNCTTNTTTKLSRRIKEDVETLDSIRTYINEQSSDNNFMNPGLYADRVVHKVFMDITESGTEAAASTAISLSRDGSRIPFRVDVPFFFFIRHEETKTVFFWGSVNSPVPSFKIV